MRPVVKRAIGWGSAAVIAASAGIIAAWEGKRNEAYLDPIGIPTACYGTTKGIKMGMRFTDQQCLDMLTADIYAHYIGVSRCVNADMPLHSLAAAVSLAYNIGVPRFCSSTLVRLINSGAPPEVYCEEFPKWRMAGGRVFQGLINRRADERLLCLGTGRWMKVNLVLLPDFSNVRGGYRKRYYRGTNGRS